MAGMCNGPAATALTGINASWAAAGTTPVAAGLTDVCALALTANGASSVEVNSVAPIRLSYGILCRWRIRTGSVITNTRIWCAFAESFLSGLGDAPSNNAVIGFRFSTNVPDAGWIGYSQPTGVGPSVSTTAAILALAINTDYDLQLEVNAAGNLATFNVNGKTATLATNFPSSSTSLVCGMSHTQLTSGAQSQYLKQIVILGG
jgi:hypothetical protein